MYIHRYNGRNYIYLGTMTRTTKSTTSSMYIHINIGTMTTTTTSTTSSSTYIPSHVHKGTITTLAAVPVAETTVSEYVCTYIHT
jgi:hypothetical protein